MGIFGFNTKKVIQINLDHIVQLIESKFNTKVLDYGIAERGDGKYERLMPIGFPPSHSGRYMCFIFIPVDDEDNVITNDYHEKKSKLEGIDISDANDQYLMYRFTSILFKDTEICDFIRSEFKGGHIQNIGALKLDTTKGYKNLVKDIDKIEDVRYRNIFYFVDDKLRTI